MLLRNACHACHAGRVRCPNLSDEPPLYPALWDVPLDDRNSTHVARIGRAIQQRDDRDDIAWLEQVPACQCLLGARANRDRKDVVYRQLGLTQ